jgi:hypothetical protein
MKYLILGLACMVCAGCVSLQYVQYEPGTGGYREELLSSRIYEVEFEIRKRPPTWSALATLGFVYVARDIGDDIGWWDAELRNLVRLRAAQLTLEAGFGYFMVHPRWPDKPGRIIIKAFSEPPEVDPSEYYDAIALQDEMRREFDSLAIPATARAPAPAPSEPCP